MRLHITEHFHASGSELEPEATMSELGRRHFLRMSVMAGTVLVAGEAAKERAMAQGASRITEVDKATVWVLVDNYYDALRPDSKVTKRYRVGPGRSIHAEHGVAFYVETVVGGKTTGCMFDYGLDPRGVSNNIALLGLDVGKAAAFGLSHGHFDHWMAAASLLAENQPRIAAGTPFYTGEEAFAQRFSLRPGRTEPDDLGRLRREDIEGRGLRIVEVTGPTEIVPGAYLTGPIARVTTYEKVPPTLLITRGDRPEPDDFRGEQALFINVRGKGLVILTGCGHAGVVNTVRQAQKVAGTEKVHAVMGGLHLVNAKPERIHSTVADLKAAKPDYVVPAHCSGFEAITAFSREMPDQFILNTAATQYTFSA